MRGEVVLAGPCEGADIAHSAAAERSGLPQTTALGWTLSEGGEGFLTAPGQFLFVA